MTPLDFSHEPGSGFESVPASIYEYKFRDIHGSDRSMGEFRGKVIVIVNTASECGFTPQYAGLETLYRRFSDQGFEIIAFPCNQFGRQEPGTGSQIGEFCFSQYSITFPIAEKISVNGPNAIPLYKFLKKERRGFLKTEAIKWNFTKFLVSRQGQVLQRFAPQVKPADLEQEIIAQLKTPYHQN